MQDPKGLRVLESLVNDVKEIRQDINQIRIDQAHNKDVNELKVEMGVLKTKIWVLYGIIGVLGIESLGVVGYLLKTWIEKR